MSTLLPIAIFLPLAASLLIGRDRELARRLALVATTGALAAALLPAGRILLDTRLAQGIGLDLPWFSAAGGAFSVRFAVGLDGLSVWPFALTCLAMLFVVAAGRKQPNHKHPSEKGAGDYRLLLIMQSGFLGLFAARDTLLFFVFYASVTISFFFLLGIHGQNGRRTAMRFICLESAGAAAVLLGLLAVVAMGQLPVAGPAAISSGLRLGIFIAMVAGFAVRVIASPFVAHIKTDGNLSGVIAGFLPAMLLSVGGVYGAIRFAGPILAEVSAAAWPWAVGLVAGGAICAGMFCVVLLVVERGASA